MKVRIGFVDFVDGVAGADVFLKDFTDASKPNGNKLIKSCWLVDGEFVLTHAKSGEQLVVPKSFAKCWTALNSNFDWVSGDQKRPPEEQEQISRAREAAKPPDATPTEPPKPPPATTAPAKPAPKPKPKPKPKVRPRAYKR